MKGYLYLFNFKEKWLLYPIIMRKTVILTINMEIPVGPSLNTISTGDVMKSVMHN